MGYSAGLIATVFIAVIVLVLLNSRASRSHGENEEANVPGEEEPAKYVNSSNSDASKVSPVERPVDQALRAEYTRDEPGGRPSTRRFNGDSGSSRGSSQMNAPADPVEAVTRREPTHERTRDHSYHITDNEYRDALRDMSGGGKRELPKPKQDRPAQSSDSEYREALRAQMKQHDVISKAKS